METFKAKIVKPARRTVAKKKKGQELEEDQRKAIETSIAEVTELITGKPLDSEAIQKMLKDLNIDPSIPLSDNDKFMIYNILMEPVVPYIKETETEGTYVLQQDKVLEEVYLETVVKVDGELKDVIPANRVLGLYDVLPSLQDNRVNFNIEKDIFRNKPLLGKGLFKCKNCTSNNTEDYEIQTRRADEGAFVKVHCRDCGISYMIT